MYFYIHYRIGNLNLLNYFKTNYINTVQIHKQTYTTHINILYCMVFTFLVFKSDKYFSIVDSRRHYNFI